MTKRLLPTEIDQWRDAHQYRFFRHKKGGIYQMRDVALCSETLAPLVIYRGEWDLWARPFDMFTDEERFKLIA